MQRICRWIGVVLLIIGLVLAGEIRQEQIKFESSIPKEEEAKNKKIRVLIKNNDFQGIVHNKIEIFCEKNELYCAIGERFENIELLQQKKFLLKETLLAASREKRINREYDFYLEMICACAADKIGHARYMEEKLQKMWEDDRIKGTEFYRSLKEYLLLRNNVSMTAKKLFIHRNTMIYRLSRVTEFLGVDINDPATANNLLISMILQETERRNS